MAIIFQSYECNQLVQISQISNPASYLLALYFLIPIITHFSPIILKSFALKFAQNDDFLAYAFFLSLDVLVPRGTY